MSALRWDSEVIYEVSRDCQDKGFRVSAEMVRRLLHQMGYSLQAAPKQNEGTAYPDRDGQFRYVARLDHRQSGQLGDHLGDCGWRFADRRVLEAGDDVPHS